MESTKKHAGTAKRVLELFINPSTDKLRHQADISMNGKFPRDYRHALQLDVQNGNIKWRDAIDLAIEQIKEYQVLKDHDKAVYAKNKVIHAPKEQNETVYSGVDSLRNLRLAMFLADLNGLPLWGADVRNAYLQALTKG